MYDDETFDVGDYGGVADGPVRLRQDQSDYRTAFAFGNAGRSTGYVHSRTYTHCGT